MRIAIWIGVVALLCGGLGGQASAGPCRDNNWQPTFVHDLIKPAATPFYVMPNGSFVPVNPPFEVNGPALCEQHGVRDRRGFTTCREYVRVQCGCDANSAGNSTCARFFQMRAQSPSPPPQAPPAPNGLVETVYIAADKQTGATSRVTLEAGRTYVVEVSGVFSCWGDKQDGVDGYYCYAQWRCPTPELWSQLLIDDQPLAEIAKKNGETLAPRPDHVYSTRVVGTGKPAKLEIADAKRGSHGDNHGGLTVRIFATGR